MSSEKIIAMSPQKNCAPIQQQKITQPLHKNIAIIAKRCRENTTFVVKFVKLLFPKVLKKFFLFSSDSSDSMDSSENNNATSPQQITQPLNFLLLLFF